MSAPSQSQSNNARGKYPMEIFYDGPSTSSSTSYAFNPSKQASHEPIATQVDVNSPGDMRLDPEFDDSASSDAGSWRSAESYFDDYEERPRTPEPPPHDEQEEELYADSALEAAMSQLSVEALARLQQKSDQGEDLNNTSGKCPMEISNNNPALSPPSLSFAFPHSQQTSHERITTQVDVNNSGSMHPDSDDAGSWLPSQSNFKERPLTLERPPHDEEPLDEDDAWLIVEAETL